MSRIADAFLRANQPARPVDAERGAETATGQFVPPVAPAPGTAPWKFERREFLPPEAAPPPADWARGRRPDPVVVDAPPAPEPTAPPSGLVEPTPAATSINPLLQERLVAFGDVPAGCLEQYRQLAARLHDAQQEKGIKIVMVTSAVLGEGKSLTSTNLAATLSESYKRRTLLIDADLRRPTLHDIFQISNVTGLSDGLKAQQSAAFATIALSPTLTLLPAGKPDSDPMAGLTSERMAHLLDEARRKFDWVIVDTPPVTMMPDAGLLAGMVDAVILVVGAGRAPFDVVKQAAKAIGRKKILGIVLNGAEAEPVPDYYTA